MDAQARTAGVTLNLEPPPKPAAWVGADPTRLLQVLLNLLSNAIKYNRRGGRVDARLTRQAAHWRLHIADDGIGMTPQQQAALFQPFNRLGREAGGSPGTGLGLVITRDLVQAMHGQLQLRSVPGAGSEFIVDLPASQEVQAVPAAAGPALLRSRSDVAGRVLCVEDDAANRELIRCALEVRPALELELVDTGAAGIAAARRAWPDLLLLDLRLPDMHGLDVLKVLRQLNPHPPLRCLVSVCEAAPDSIARAKAAGVDDYLAKPIDLARLVSLIDGLIGAKPSPHPAGSAGSSAAQGKPH